MEKAHDDDDGESQQIPRSYTRDAMEGEPRCCICMERLACATVSRCGHNEFCYPCIFSIKRQTGNCPLCREGIEEIKFDEIFTLKDLSEVLTNHDWRTIHCNRLETLEDYADFFDYSNQKILEYLFCNWLHYKNKGKMHLYLPTGNDGN